MTEIEFLENIKRKYINKRYLNEAETRFKIIDSILLDVLKWPKDNMSLELIINGIRADYILKDKNEKPILIIESKKSGAYFELPNDSDYNKSYKKIVLEKLLTNKTIKDAILQVKEYAEDLMAPYACICNGNTWVIFKIQSPLKPWKKLNAFVIKDINFFIDEFTYAVNLLGYTSVVQMDSLDSIVGVSKKVLQEIYYPKNNISAYNMPIVSNKYAAPLSILSRKYLGVIPESDVEFMSYCYVKNKGRYDNLQKDVQGFLYDSLTPYHKKLGFREFTDDNNGGAFGIRISEIIQKENLDNVMILFGGRGSGKSTFLKRFLFFVKPRDIYNYAHVALVDLLNSSQKSDDLVDEIWRKILESIDLQDIRNGSRSDILNLFKLEFEVYERQILVGLNPESPEYQKLLREFVQKCTSNTKLFCEKLSLALKNKNKGLIIFLDNMDQLSPQLQDTCFLLAEEIANKLSCLLIVSMREERYYNAKSKGVLDAYHTPGFHLAAPVIPEVIIRRLEYILERLKYTLDVDFEFGIKNTSDLNTLNAFFSICINQLKKSSSPLSYFLRFATHGDVRQALEFFKGFLTSGYINISEMADHPGWWFQVHQVIKPMMIPDRFFYDENLSKIPNLYKLRCDNDSSHFTGLRILRYLHNRSTDKTTSGYIDVKFFIHTFEMNYGNKEDCIKHLDLYLQSGIIESSNRLEGYSDEVDQIKISALGDYIFEYLAFNFAYIDLTCLDAGVFSESLNNYLIASAKKELEYKNSKDFMSRIKLRLDRAKKFVEYLTEQETQEYTDFGIDSKEAKFTDKLQQSIKEQEENILKSAEKKFKREESEL